MATEFKQGGNDIIIDDGSKLYNIKNRRGEILSQFSFRPTDTNIVERYKEVEIFFDTFSAPKDADLEDLVKLFSEKMDYLVNAEMSGAFFQIMGPFSPMHDGRMFWEVCLESVCGVIEKEMNVRLKKNRSRVDKYTKKYHG